MEYDSEYENSNINFKQKIQNQYDIVIGKEINTSQQKEEIFESKKVKDKEKESENEEENNKEKNKEKSKFKDIIAISGLGSEFSKKRTLALDLNNNYINNSNILNTKTKSKNVKKNNTYNEVIQERHKFSKTFEIQKNSKKETSVDFRNENDYSQNFNNFDSFDLNSMPIPKKKDSIKGVNANYKNSFKHKIKEALDNKKTLMVMTIASVYALILSDLNIIFFSKGLIDIIFNVFSTIVFSLFFIEFTLSSISKDNYIFTFIFWMDFASMLSMLVSIEWAIFPFLDLFSIKKLDRNHLNPFAYKIMKSLSLAIRTTRYYIIKILF
jgi:hypothetical protein